MIKRDEDGNFVADADGVLKTKRCPYWSLNVDRHYQDNGYCAYSEIGDWQERRAGYLSLVWDQVKSCGINMDDEEDNIFGIPITMIE